MKIIEFNRSQWMAMEVPSEIRSRSIRFRRWKPLRHSEISNWRFFLNLLEISDILRNYSFRWSSSSSIDPNWWQWKSPVISTRDPSDFVHGSPCVTPKYRSDGFFWIFSKFRIFWEIIVSIKMIEFNRSQLMVMEVPIDIHSRSIRFLPWKPVRHSEVSNWRFFLNLFEISDILRNYTSDQDDRVQSIPIDGNGSPQWYPLEIHRISSMEAPGSLRSIELTVFLWIFSKFRIFWEIIVSIKMI